MSEADRVFSPWETIELPPHAKSDGRFAAIGIDIGSTTAKVVLLDGETPVVEIYEDGKEKVTYVKLDAKKAEEIVEKHLKGGSVVTEYTIGNK
jgi:(2Fe-2S) ferredoxin